jgi:hypothetical protein
MTRNAVIVLLAIGLLHAAKLTPLHGWSDDGSVYLRHALNIVEGRPYGDILHGTTSAGIGPPSRYPPVLPLLLAPLVAVRGLDFILLKLAMLAIFVAALSAAYAALRSFCPPDVALAAVGLCGMNFSLWAIADHVNSDFLFLLLIAVLFHRLWSLGAADMHGARLLGHSLLIGILVGLAYGTRSAGVLLPFALALHSLWRYHTITRFVQFSIAWSLLAMVVLQAWTPGAGPTFYYDFVQTLLSWSNVRRNLIQYPLAVGGLFAGTWTAAGVAGVLALYGAWLLVRNQRHPWIVFAGLYGATLVLWPFSDPVRFLVPVAPLLAACVVYGGVTLAKRLAPRVWRPALAVVLIGILAVQGQLHAEHAKHGYGAGLNYPSTVALYRAIQTLTEASAVIAARKPRSISLFTERRSLAYASIPPDATKTDLCAAGVTHIVIAPHIFPDDAATLVPFLNAFPQLVPLLYENQDYQLRGLHCDRTLASR